jgi:transposase
MSQPVSSAYVADELGVSRSAVSNWVARDSLPEELKPEMVKGPGKGRPQWREDQLPGLRSWLAGHHPRHKRTFLTEVAPAELKPGDFVISVQYGLRMSVLVRRTLEKD